MMHLLAALAYALNTASGGSPLEAGSSAGPVLVERTSVDDVHVPSRLLNGLESKLDAGWELPPELRSVGAQGLLSLSETAGGVGAQPLECAAPSPARKPGRVASPAVSKAHPGRAQVRVRQGALQLRQAVRGYTPVPAGAALPAG